MTEIWAGIDAGKAHHHCVVIDPEGRRLLSRRVANDECELLGLLGDVAALGDHVTWAVDLNAGGAALLISVLFNHDQRPLYIPGRVVHRASAMYRGDGKTDGLAPVPRDSGRISGNLHRPRRYSRRLLRVFYTSSLVSIQHCTASRRYYRRKRAEGKRHTQAVLALARRRVDCRTQPRGLTNDVAEVARRARTGGPLLTTVST
ncbi:IS110 family transposase [Saccharopolyspora sp. S2-29]|uniref:IS110 family transposase n=1 Tax=Saccharopolyspora mangrovi TaxID=3082379 RepID=A0ABU6AEN9_9PSEU|nr:IS110 family transposase [Saccharopolyspora sp. S2-29]MEB3370012.1 IS110 family transposase [Saccharopolyspora sp. S2-29]